MFGLFHLLERTYIMTFSSDIKEFAEKTNRNIEDVRANAAIKIFGDIVKATPVGHSKWWAPVNGKPAKAPPGYTGGRLRGNWQTSLNSTIDSTIANIDANGSETINKMTAVVAVAKGEDTIFMTNNLPYAVPVEYGHSKKQRPMGMMMVSITGWNNAIKAALQKVDK